MEAIICGVEARYWFPQHNNGARLEPLFHLVNVHRVERHPLDEILSRFEAFINRNVHIVVNLRLLDTLYWKNT